MIDAWSVLEESGMPDGPPRVRHAGPLDVVAVRAALDRLAREESPIPDGGREALLGWLRALRHHWPSRYDELAGASGRALEERLQPIADANRYLKLRRIAIENLSTLI